MPYCPYYPGVRIKRALRKKTKQKKKTKNEKKKNVKETYLIDIKIQGGHD